MRIWLVRGLGLAAAISISAAASAPQGAGQARLSVRDAVALYARGDFSAAVRDLNLQGLKVAPFTRALDAWIAEGDAADRQRRGFIAAAFAIDANWAVTQTLWQRMLMRGDPSNRIPPVDPEREVITQYYSLPLVAEWAVRQLPTIGVPDPLERTLWLSAIALAEDGSAWHRLQAEILPPARKRLPDESRVRLAEALARTNLDVRGLRTVLPSFRDTLRDERLRPGVADAIPGAIRVFEQLLADASLAGEAELRIGYLELRRKNWSAALTRLEAARSKATEPTIRATADYFTGWVCEQLESTDDAVAAYRRALAITPTIRNLATRQSALLYLRNERTEAYSVLDIALNARPVPIDLLVVMERADARFVPEWLESIRKALK